MLYVYITRLIRHLKGELKKVIDQAQKRVGGGGVRARNGTGRNLAFRAKPNSADLVSTGKSG